MDFAQGNQGQVPVFAELFQIGQMLEEVGVDFLVAEAQVGFHIVGEFHHLQVNPFLGQDGFHFFQDFCMGNRRSAHLQDHFLVSPCGFAAGGAAASSGDPGQGQEPGQYQCQFFHRFSSLFCIDWIFSSQRPLTADR